MDCSWLHENDDKVDSLNSDDSDCEEVERELESRLYAIVHHNDLSQPLPPELAKHYSIQHSDNGNVTVILNQSLDQLKSEESKVIDKVLESPELLDDKPKETIVISDEEKKNDGETKRQPKRRFRYSDVNIDEINKTQNEINTDFKNKIQEPIQFETSYERLTYLLGPNHKEFSNIYIPPYCGYLKFNSNFTFGSQIVKDPTFRWKMIKQLMHLNPGVKKQKIVRLANLLIRKNDKIAKQSKKRDLRNSVKNNSLNGLDIMKNLPVEVTDESLVDQAIRDNVINFEANRIQHEGNNTEIISLNISSLNNSPEAVNYKQKSFKSQKKKGMDGSVSVNISPFRPNSPNVEISNKNPSQRTDTGLPTKWSKEMIAYYSIPCKKKMYTNINSIFRHFNRTTNANDWWLEPQDRTGVYQHPPNKKKLPRRCANCMQRDHLTKNCLEPKKKKVCFLCGKYKHSGYNCPNTICIKCGVYSPDEECADCYYHTFQYEESCERCGSPLHRTTCCPDAWRRFHATTEGELKIPEKTIENKRKYCCNCARWGHFSHKCPSPHHAGQQTNPFVTNYSSSPFQKGVTQVSVPQKFVDIINSPECDKFLQGLSNKSNARIQVEGVNDEILVNITGTFGQCINVSSNIEAYINTRKRKREEPHLGRKRRRLK